MESGSAITTSWTDALEADEVPCPSINAVLAAHECASLLKLHSRKNWRKALPRLCAFITVRATAW
jgi:hypothetical protein